VNSILFIFGGGMRLFISVDENEGMAENYRFMWTLNNKKK
jgi:hypothetical protein